MALLSGVLDMILAGGDHWVITTEGPAKLVMDSPWPGGLVKQSTYAVVCGHTLYGMVSSIVASWWKPTDDKKIVTHFRNGKKYLLCTLDKKSGFRGSSQFINPEGGELFDKSDVREWLQAAGEFAETMTIPVDTIIKVVPNGPTVVNTADNLPDYLPAEWELNR